MKRIINVLGLSGILLILSSGIYAQEDQEMVLPRPFAIAIDDMGWMNGSSLGENNGPWRAGVKRKMDVNDYKAVVDIAEAAGVRLQGLFILCEMDRTNACARVPSSTWKGAKWDNSANISDEQFRIMDYLKSHADHLEFGLHGVGHEYWEKGERQRAEWYCTQNDHPWPEDSIRRHIALFKEIMAQYGLTKENGYSFPQSFVACAYSYYWNPSAKPYSLGKILHENGVKYANTLLQEVKELNPPKEGGFDNGVLVVDRWNCGNPWYEPASLPTIPIEDFKSDVIETHWPNLLAADEWRQPELQEKWVEFFHKVQAKPNRYVTKNTEQFNSQWVLFRYAKLEKSGKNKVTIDTRNVPDWAYSGDFIKNMVLKCKLADGQMISKALVDGKPIPACCVDQGYAMLYLPPLDKGVHTFEWSIGNNWQEGLVLNDGTYNVYQVSADKRQTKLEVRVYGSQNIKVVLSKEPKDVTSSVSGLNVKDWEYNENKKLLTIAVNAHDIQGETSVLTIDL